MQEGRRTRRARGRKALAGCLLAAFCSLHPGGVRAAESAAEEATRLVNEGRFEEALARFTEAIRGEPKNASLHLGLGLALQSLGRYPDAVQSLEKASKLAPASAEPFYSLALIFEAAAADPALLDGPNAPESTRRQYLQRARKAWEKVARLSKDGKRVEVAKEHLARLADALR